jgi:hypothetical protein
MINIVLLLILLLIIFFAGTAKGGVAEGGTQVLNFIKASLLLTGLVIVAVTINNFN